MTAEPASPPPPDPTTTFATSTADALRALAGPGTGKTYALIRRLAALLEQGVDPAEILVVTFARTAARDLVSAVGELEAAGDELVPRTLHSFCFSILGRQHVLQATGRTPRIVLDFERNILLKDLQGDFGTLRDRQKLVVAFEAAWARRQAEPPGSPVPGLDQGFQDELLDTLRWHRAMMVGEVVPIALYYLQHNPQAEERAIYTHVLVDEYQDLNRAEQEVLNLLSSDSKIAIIGDDDQSIYGFKHANPEGIRNFHEDHTGTEDVEFVICRRCPSRVVKMAQTIVQRNPGRLRGPLEPMAGNPDGEIHHVQFRSIEEEAAAIADFVNHKIDSGQVEAGKCLILANRRVIGYAIRDAIRERGIDCSSYFREEPVDSDKAKEILTLITLLEDPDDRVALRAWLALGSSTERRGPYRRLYAAARERACSVREILDRLDDGELSIPHTGGALDRYRELLVALENLPGVADRPTELIDRLMPEEDNELDLLRQTALAAVADADQIVSLGAALRYGVAQRETPLESSEVRVMSMHASKGLTADLVVLGGLVEGLMPQVLDAEPDDQATQLQEQRRVFFVGMTRTRRILVFSTYSQLPAAVVHRLQVARGQAIGYGQAFRTFASQFLGELGDELPDAVRGQDWDYG